MPIGNVKLPRQIDGSQVEVGDDFLEEHPLSSHIARKRQHAFPRTLGRDATGATSQNVRMGRKTTKPPANHLRAWREFRGMTQAALAEKTNTKDNVIGALEAGERQLTEKWLERLSQALGTTKGYLLDHDPNDLHFQLIEVAEQAAKRNGPERVMNVLRALDTGTDG